MTARDANEMPARDGEQSKEVYAYFGLAYSSACVFESALINALLHIEYLSEVKRQYRGQDTFDRAAFQAGFDRFMTKQQSISLGALIKRMQSLVEMEADLKDLIRNALARRNFLAHRFFWDRAVDFFKRDGRARMIMELKNDAALFEKAERALDDFASPYRAKVGMTDEILRKWMARYYEDQGLAGEFQD